MAKNPKVELFPPTGELCPGFFKLNAVSGCPYSCMCYLDFTTGRMNGGKKIISISTVENTAAAVQKWFKSIGDTPVLLNTGETGDSWAFPSCVDLNRELVRLFDGRPQALLFLTKSSNTNMLEMPLSQDVYSFSVNPPAVAEAFGAPIVENSFLHRLQAQGRRIRLRLDPIIPVPRWADHYEKYVRELATTVFTDTKPEMITLGSLRLTDGHHRLRVAQEHKLLDHVERCENSGHHPWRMSVDRRIAMYRWLVTLIRHSFGSDIRIGLCKESAEMRQSVGVAASDCNCLL